MVPPDVQGALDVTPVNRKVQKCSLGYIAGKQSIVFSLSKVANKISISVCVWGGGRHLFITVISMNETMHISNHNSKVTRN